MYKILEKESKRGSKKKIIKNKIQKGGVVTEYEIKKYLDYLNRKHTLYSLVVSNDPIILGDISPYDYLCNEIKFLQLYKSHRDRDSDGYSYILTYKSNDRFVQVTFTKDYPNVPPKIYISDHIAYDRITKRPLRLGDAYEKILPFSNMSAWERTWKSGLTGSMCIDLIDYIMYKDRSLYGGRIFYYKYFDINSNNFRQIDDIQLTFRMNDSWNHQIYPHQWILSYDKQMELIRNGRGIDALNNVNVWTKPRNLGIILCSLELSREDILQVDIDKNIFLNNTSRLNLASIFGF